MLINEPMRSMADTVRVWFDAEGDFLEVRFSDAVGYMKETAHDAVMERVGSINCSTLSGLFIAGTGSVGFTHGYSHCIPSGCCSEAATLFRERSTSHYSRYCQSLAPSFVAPFNHQLQRRPSPPQLMHLERGPSLGTTGHQ